MQRAAFPELQGRSRPPSHRRQAKPDRVLLGLKIATFVAACGVLAVMVLLMTGGPSNPVSQANPPKAATGQVGDDAPRQQPAPTAEQPVAEPPALRTETAEINGAPSTSKAPKPTSAPVSTPRRQQRTPVVGEPCPQMGMWSMTENFEPVVCYGDSPPRWRRVF